MMFDVVLWGLVCFGFIALVTANWGCFFGSHKYVYIGKVVTVTRNCVITRSKYRCKVCDRDKNIRPEDFSYSYNRR